MRNLIIKALPIILVFIVNWAQIADSQLEQQLPIISIINLNEKKCVDGVLGIIGNISGDIPNGKCMWLFVCRNTTPGEGRPQCNRINPYNGKWYQQALIDPDGNDIGKEFDINVILVGEEEDRHFKDNSERDIEIPENAIECCRKTVCRG